MWIRNAVADPDVLIVGGGGGGGGGGKATYKGNREEGIQVLERSARLQHIDRHSLKTYECCR